jgi:glycosyltransferase involved in cell wall biosynthesis
MRPALETLARDSGVAGQVEFLGALRGDEVPAAMEQARIGVVPSTWEEPYGGVSLEWLAAGRNLIVSARGGHAECVGDAALHFENGDVESLRTCMSQLLSDGALAEAQRQRARNRIEAFDEERLAQRFIDLYARAVQTRGERSISL